MAQLQLKLNENLFQKDPQSTDLGLRIIEKSIEMIDKLGFETFTFKKLSKEIESTEASIYRYFENKHRLLIYLISWYWSWTEYRIIFDTHSLEDPSAQLSKALEIICAKHNYDKTFPVVNEAALQRIVINESDKTYLTKDVDEINKEGVFRGYKSLCKLVADMVKKINPAFVYPHALISTVLEASHQQVFFAHHLPSLTEMEKENAFEKNELFLKNLVFNTIAKK
jgi:AcrR family transcriptional regulator